MNCVKFIDYRLGHKIKNSSKGQITEDLQCQVKVVTGTLMKEFELSIISLELSLRTASLAASCRIN